MLSRPSFLVKIKKKQTPSRVRARGGGEQIRGHDYKGDINNWVYKTEPKLLHYDEGKMRTVVKYI